jgi:hypothetical protein
MRKQKSKLLRMVLLWQSLAQALAQHQRAAHHQADLKEPRHKLHRRVDLETVIVGPAEADRIAIAVRRDKATAIQAREIQAEVLVEIQDRATMRDLVHRAPVATAVAVNARFDCDI